MTVLITREESEIAAILDGMNNKSFDAGVKVEAKSDAASQIYVCVVRDLSSQILSPFASDLSIRGPKRASKRLMQSFIVEWQPVYCLPASNVALKCE